MKKNYEKLCNEVDKMNEFTSIKTLIKDYIINGHELKNGVTIRNVNDYKEYYKNSGISRTLSTNHVELIKKANNKKSCTSLYKELSFIIAITFFYPIEVIHAIEDITVID